MLRPPYWLHKNIKIPDEEIEQVIDGLKRCSKELTARQYPVLSSYFFKMHQRPDKIWQKKYSNIVKDITKEVGLYTNSRYEFEYWCQYYTTGKKHDAHEHTSLIMNFGVISFVHFLKNTEGKEFQFTDRVGNTFVPPEQNEGDLICMPAWCWHEVRPNTNNKERFVIAGNIVITEMSPPADEQHHKFISNNGYNL